MSFAFLIPLGIKDPARDFGVPSTKNLGQLVITREDNECLFRSIPEMIARADRALLDRAGGRYRSLEGYILIHEDTEVRDRNVLHKLRYAFKDPEVGVVGTYGATGVTGLDWWLGTQKGRYPVPAARYGDGGDRTVDCVDGHFMAISPWCAHNVAYDVENFYGFHGYDVDYCFEVRKAGKLVVVADIDVWHHSPGGYGDPRGALGGYEAWLTANDIFIDKWGL